VKERKDGEKERDLRKKHLRGEKTKIDIRMGRGGEFNPISYLAYERGALLLSNF